MKLSEFKAKHVQGLYSFNHFEHESGAFIQAHVNGGLWVYQDATGKRHDFYSIAELKAFAERHGLRD